jgi:hypothetical protein
MDCIQYSLHTLTMFSCKMNRTNRCTRCTFAAFPSQYRLEHLSLTVSAQVFDREPLDTVQSMDLQTMSVGIYTTGALASLRSLFLPQPLPSTDFLLCYHSPHFIFGSFLPVFDALGIKASYTCCVSFRDIQAPAVSETSSAENVTAM